MLAESLLHEDHVVQRRDYGEEKSRSKKHGATDPDPLYSPHIQKEHEEDSAYLRKSVGFAENTGTEIAQTGNSEQDSARSEDRDIAAEHHYRVLPGNPVKD